MKNSILILVSSVYLTACSLFNPAPALPPFADIHLHFNWDHEELLSAKEAVNILKKHNVVLASVSSVPSDYALKLKAAGGDWIIPFVSPYYHPANRLNWYYDKKLVAEIRKRLETGNYAGIGEVHIVAGIGPRRDNPVFVGLLELAKEFNLPFLIHTDAGDHRFFLSICRKYPQVRFLWAHAGGVLGPKQLDPLMQACPNVWLDMAARDPWHYDLFAYDDYSLIAGWRELIIKYQDRIVTGTDPVWNAQDIYRWYEADEGWAHYAKFQHFHRNWIKRFPADIEEKLRLTNAQRFFGVKGRALF